MFRVICLLTAGLLLLTACEEEAKDGSSATPTQASGDQPSVTDAPTEAPTVAPTAVPPVELSGVGQTATQEVTPPAAFSSVTFSHDGSSNFIVSAFQGDDEELLVNEIGAYSGTRLLESAEPVLFDIDADGAWTLRITAPTLQDNASFSGSGDSVSGMFDPPDRASWTVSHDGEANFIVLAVCDGGTQLVQNEIGVISGSTVIDFDDGPCLWEVQADGAWSLTPQ